MQLALEMLRDDWHKYHTCRIYSDSQAIDKPRRQSGQAIIKEILDSIDITRKHPQLRITVVWIPGHREIEGNEQADQEAKKAATEKTCLHSQRRMLVICRAAILHRGMLRE